MRGFINRPKEAHDHADHHGRRGASSHRGRRDDGHRPRPDCLHHAGRHAGRHRVSARRGAQRTGVDPQLDELRSRGGVAARRRDLRRPRPSPHVRGRCAGAGGDVGVATFAPDTLMLVLTRIGQGLGAAAVLACGLGLIGHVVPVAAARVRATGVWGAGVGAGIAIGPLVAAGLADASGPGWRIPYALLAVAAALLAVWARKGLVESTAERPRAVDGWDMLLLGLALAGLLAGLVETRAGG